MYCRPSTLSICPHDGCPVGPKPRKLKLASCRITPPKAVVALTSTSGMMFGMMHLRMMLAPVAPMLAAASTYWACLRLNTCDR